MVWRTQCTILCMAPEPVLGSRMKRKFAFQTIIVMPFDDELTPKAGLKNRLPIQEIMITSTMLE